MTEDKICKALSFYANKENYIAVGGAIPDVLPAICKDRGKLAREALATSSAVTDMEDELVNMRCFMKRLYKLTKELPDFIDTKPAITDETVKAVAEAIEKKLNEAIDAAVDNNTFPEIKSDELAKAAIRAMQAQGGV